MKALAFCFFVVAFGQDNHWKLNGDSEGQFDSAGERLYFSQILTEQYRSAFFLQRYFPAQGRVPRYEIGAGWVFKKNKLGPCSSLVLKPYSGLAVEDRRYLLSSMIGFGTCYGHKILIINDRKNGSKGSFQYNRVAVKLYKWIWFRWDGFYKDLKPAAWTQLANQPGIEVEVPLGKSTRAFASAQYDLVTGRRIHHFGFRF